MRTLDEWLSWQETLHPEEIELGLERIRRVATRLNILSPEPKVVTVAGTNGKGSSIAILESIALAAGLRVGVYTSPHLLRYNERIRVNGKIVTDDLLCDSFEVVDEARQQESITYFEFGTLAALEIFRRQPLDLIVLEVGLGGRLDAVNIIDADVALLTTVDLDHQSWLGESREEIGREKAGIFRSGRAAVIGDFDIPLTVSDYARTVGVPLFKIGRDFCFVTDESGWSWRGSSDREIYHLPFPALYGEIQVQNSAAVLEVIEQLGWMDKIGEEKIAEGLSQSALMGRFQTIQHAPEVIVDVSHNPQAARTVAENLASTATDGKTIAVVAMLKDKELKVVIEALSPEIDQWMVAGLDVARGASSSEIEKVVVSTVGDSGVDSFETVQLAFESAIGLADSGDRIIVFGSFYTVAAVLDLQ
ncbi:MAG: bifunctional tetrahydrofolate synthase/dihydrofolate synthase [Gammaproteobacteria bacterium]|uniref:Dihydrofolate synthase/folylpolyglutamate synthase n=1 Tax=Candidatus Thiopontia autotrophica TaxID=2841688 RepID=A0A8J6TSX6_9GAMM|nr:bifunctional tetrahydrofolate synthase/dihydrofolate synthase [Candidatus Thiopontia autotrophica]MBL6969149.1 bifunctional tetrahydrofolate synthase/dihydrofolate synthase [Gammaproteobacteria bacterium]